MRNTGRASDIIPLSFFERSTLVVAQELLGKRLVRLWRGKRIEGIITETEAYDGIRDKACHAFKGKTERNKVMFGPPGHWYLYFVYGMHWMLNIVTREGGYPAAVLIRGICSPVLGDIEGPGRVTKHLRLGRPLYGLPAAPESGLWVEETGIVLPKGTITRTPRIGVDYAGEWARKKWRFLTHGVDR